ncbi:hypothetical protein [Pseudomonas sp.]|uniref:hypothetical protein n=1 Tax=Pseudomonas sp. TaxID=306 RepID=UPI003FD7BEE2
MTRQEFIDYFIKAEDVAIYGVPKPNVRIGLSLIGAIYDLQQQITQKDEYIIYLDQRLISLEREVYK